MEKKDLKVGDILLCPPIPGKGGEIGRVIVMLTKGKVSHAALYYGERNGVPTVVHSDLRGIIYQDLDEFISEEPGFYVLNYQIDKKDVSELTPVLEAADIYAGKGIKYPKGDFVILGMLILMKRLTKEKIKDRIFYDFILMLCRKTMKKINPKNSKTCSQLVSQCFTDAGDEYDIRFSSLILKSREQVATDGDVSLLDLLNPSDSLVCLEMLADEDSNILSEEDEKIVERFVTWMGDSENIHIGLPKDMIEEKQLIEASQTLLSNLCQIISGKKVNTILEAIDIISSTNRNYFVLPDDLLSTTTNLKLRGYIEGKQK